MYGDSILKFYPDFSIEYNPLGGIGSLKGENVIWVAKQHRGYRDERFLIATDTNLYPWSIGENVDVIIGESGARYISSMSLSALPSEIIDFSSIHSIEHTSSMLSRYSGRIVVEVERSIGTLTKTVTFENLDKKYSGELAKYIKSRISKVGASQDRLESAAQEWRELYLTTLMATHYKLQSEGQQYNNEEVTDAVLRGTSRQVAEKYRLSQQEMDDIFLKWASRLKDLAK